MYECSGEKVSIKAITICIFNLTPPTPPRSTTSTPWSVRVTRNICFKIRIIPIVIHLPIYILHKWFKQAISRQSLTRYRTSRNRSLSEGKWSEQRIVFIRPSQRELNAFGHHTRPEFPIIIWIFRFHPLFSILFYFLFTYRL